LSDEEKNSIRESLAAASGNSAGVVETLEYFKVNEIDFVK